ncbi:MAG: PAS domain-containing sensor histidine kinase [Candidatus Cloacimonetes bacterium]|nr:PAS domain-containing sensor histidine kinase [Candidatus Cloacimonadota bacterium]MDD4805603.1 PAS domain-containing sensor histidine kinase [Candidatus Cloacimonadota bacterium]
MEKKESVTDMDVPNQDARSNLRGISPELLPNLMHNLPGMAYRCKFDENFTMLFLSEGSVELTEYEAGDMLYAKNISYDVITHPEDRDRVRETILSAVKHHTQYQMEYRIITKSGLTKWVWEKGNAVYDQNMNPIYLDGFITDVSARRNAEDNLQKAADDLAELNATKDRFFSLLAHDLQNPVYAIISLSEFISENYQKFDAREIEDAMLQVNSAARGIYTLLENLLDWARLQSGELECQTEFVSLTKAISYAVDHHARAASQKGIALEIEQDSDMMVECDLRLLTSILRNMISNALKYSYPKSSVKVVLRKYEGRAEISVIDNGVGIARKHLEKIFRIDNELRQYGTANESGSGLGLILVSSFARLIGAEVKVESKLNHGSTFTLLLGGKID